MKQVIDKKLFLILFFFYSIYNGVRILKNIIFKYYDIALKEVSWGKFFVDFILIDSILMVILIVVILFLTRRMIAKNYSVKVVFLWHIVFAVITWFLTYVLYFLYLYAIGKFNLSKQDVVISIINYSDKHFLFYLMNVFIIYAYYYINKSAQVELQRIKLKEQLASVQVNVLKYQLHPHFFFNTLNSISTLIDVDPKLAQNTLADFSDLLRDILFLKDTNLLPLSVEMKILKRYIDIMGIRFSDHLEVTINMDENLENILIPSLILQPIIENSIKHGYSYDNTDLKIGINIQRNASELTMQIVNNGDDLPENFKYGTGLKNTIDRLKTLYGDDYSFIMKNNSDKGIVTIIKIPIKSE